MAFVAMLAAALVFRAEHLSDWDSWDYAAESICGHSSDLLLGRWWFVAAMRAAYLAGRGIFNLGPLDGYLPMQAACAFLMAAAVVAGMVWTYRLTRSVAAEVIFAALIVSGPLFGIYASAVMTEGATLLMLTLALLGWERAISAKRSGWVPAFLAGLSFGVAVDMREPAVLLGAWVIISCLVDRPAGFWRLLAAGLAGAALTIGIGVLGAWAWYPWAGGYWANIARWAGWMAAERLQFGVSIVENAGLVAMFAFAAAPVLALGVLPAGLWSFMRRRRLFWLAVAAGPYVGSLLINHDLSVNPRFVLPAVWLLAPVLAAAINAWLVRRPGRSALRLAAAGCIIIAFGAMVVTAGWGQLQKYYFQYTRSQHRMYRVMLRLPADAVVIAGPGTPVAYYLNRLGVKRFTVIGSGWSWPGGRLAERIAEELDSHERVYANLDGADWLRTFRKSQEWDQLSEACWDYALDPVGGGMFELLEPPEAPVGTAVPRLPAQEDAPGGARR